MTMHLPALCHFMESICIALGLCLQHAVLLNIFFTIILHQKLGPVKMHISEVMKLLQS